MRKRDFPLSLDSSWTFALALYGDEKNLLVQIDKNHDKFFWVDLSVLGKHQLVVAQILVECVAARQAIAKIRS